jgi:hypothetical protein
MARKNEKYAALGVLAGFSVNAGRYAMMTAAGSPDKEKAYENKKELGGDQVDEGNRENCPIVPISKNLD